MFTTDNKIFTAIYRATGRDLMTTKVMLEAVTNLELETDKIDFILAFSAAKIFDEKAERQAQVEYDIARSDAANKTKASRDERVANWVIDNVKPGMMIKVSGARDGQGFRKVMELKTNRLGDVTIVGRKWTQGRTFIGVSKDGLRSYKTYMEESPYITDHMPKKVVKVIIDDEWKNVVDIIKEEANNERN